MEPVRVVMELGAVLRDSDGAEERAFGPGEGRIVTNNVKKVQAGQSGRMLAALSGQGADKTSSQG